MLTTVSKMSLTGFVAAGLMLGATMSSHADVIVDYFDGTESLSPHDPVSFITAETATVNSFNWRTSFGAAGTTPAGPIAGAAAGSYWAGVRATEDALSTDDYVSFEITYTGSDTLSLDSLRFNWTAAADVSSGEVQMASGWALFVSVNSGAFTVVDSFNADTADMNIIYDAPGFSAGGGIVPGVATENVDLSGLAALSNGDTIELRLATADIGGNSVSTFLQGLELSGDEITTPIPEPASVLLFASGACLVAGGRRRNKTVGFTK